MKDLKTTLTPEQLNACLTMIYHQLVKGRSYLHVLNTVVEQYGVNVLYADALIDVVTIKRDRVL